MCGFRKFDLRVQYDSLGLFDILGEDAIDGKDSPAVTIQLAEHETPINILTGVDCWLDNLICDVPEVVMFFHDNGFLSNFEKIPTDQIPNVAEFNPDTVRDRSLNI